ncbi:MAG TPA: hypothetical protein VFM45_12985, partial [Anaeromyxobacteraceae bacterium]|nr:hypothetical protein [Anaeromyxobacteraceae bacterium]
MTLDERLAAARGGGAAGPVESRGILRLAGKGARDFLHRISTQHVAKLPADGSTYAAFLDNHGHVVGEGLVVARPDDLLLLTEADEVPLLLPHLRKYLLAAPVRIDDASAELAAMAVLGPAGVDRARAAAAGAPVTVAATPRRGVPAVEVVGPREALEALRDEHRPGLRFHPLISQNVSET